MHSGRYAAPRAFAGDPTRFVTPDELRRFSTIEPWRIAARAAATWGLVLGAVGAWAVTRHLGVLAIAFLVIGACQHAFFLLAHEGAHGLIARRKWLNDLLTDLCFAAPIFYTTARYRDGHLPHHTHLGDHRHDQERRTWVLINGRHFARLLVRVFTGWAAVRAVVGLTPEKLGVRQSPWRWLGGVVLTNGALGAYCAALGVPSAYLWLWIVPLLTLSNFLLVVRAVAEHQPFAYARRDRPDERVDLTPALTRTFGTGPIQRFLFAPIGARRHHEHHLYPGVPFTQLERLHATLVQRGYFDARAECVEASHWSLLWRLISGGDPVAPASARGAPRG